MLHRLLKLLTCQSSAIDSLEHKLQAIAKKVPKTLLASISDNYEPYLVANEDAMYSTASIFNFNAEIDDVWKMQQDEDLHGQFIDEI